jgi:hypothetical protein
MDQEIGLGDVWTELIWLRVWKRGRIILKWISKKYVQGTRGLN